MAGAINEIWRLSVKGLVHGQQHQHSLHFRTNVPLLNGAGLVTAWSGAPMTAYRACFNVYGYPTQLIQAQMVCGQTPVPGATEVVPAVALQAGTRSTTSDDPQPAFIAALVNEKGTLAGRSRSGRFFLGGLFESDVVGDYIQAPHIARIQAYIDALKTLFVTPSTPDWRLFCYSQLLATGRPGSDPPIPVHQCQDAGSDTAQLIVSNRVTTMRSRKLGHGL